MKRPSFQFYPSDWLSDEKLGDCQPTTRGIWMDLLCLMWKNQESGIIEGAMQQLSQKCRCTNEQMESAVTDLINTKTANVTERNGKVTIINRRMNGIYKDKKSSQIRAKRFREKHGNDKVTPKVTRELRSHTSSSTSTSSSTTKQKLTTSARSGDKPRPSKKPAKPKIWWTPETNFTDITDKNISDWKAAYPACDIPSQLLRANEWLIANPLKAKKKLWRKFITGWFQRSQERGGDLRGQQSSAQPAYVAPVPGDNGLLPVPIHPRTGLPRTDLDKWEQYDWSSFPLNLVDQNYRETERARREKEGVG